MITVKSQAIIGNLLNIASALSDPVLIENRPKAQYLVRLRDQESKLRELLPEVSMRSVERRFLSTLASCFPKKYGSKDVKGISESLLQALEEEGYERRRQTDWII